MNNVERPIKPNRSSFNQNYNLGLSYAKQVSNLLDDVTTELRNRKEVIPNDSLGGKDALGQNTLEGLDTLISKVESIIETSKEAFSNAGKDLDLKEYNKQLSRFEVLLKKYNETNGIITESDVPVVSGSNRKTEKAIMQKNNDINKTYVKY